MPAVRKTNAAVRDAISAATQSRAAFELKGIMTPLTVLRLRSRDLNLVERQLRAKVTQMPQFFDGAPVVLDLGELGEDLGDFPLAALAQALRVCRVVPVGVTNIPDHHRDLARAAGLGVLQPGPLRPQEQDSSPPPPATPDPVLATATTPPLTAETAPQVSPAAPSSAPAPGTIPTLTTTNPHRPPVVVRQAVRSGQEIYARQNDLIVLAPVNPGAQVYADGHIHIYAPLRGRAMAGAQGMRDARIYCQKMEAELVAVAGAYVMADDMPPAVRGKPAQVYMEHGECRIGPLG